MTYRLQVRSRDRNQNMIKTYFSFLMLKSISCNAMIKKTSFGWYPFKSQIIYLNVSCDRVSQLFIQIPVVQNLKLVH
jgi:hypothetical protein